MSKRTVSKGKIRMVIYAYSCSKCGNKMYVPRHRSNVRENNHMKKLYCVNCKKRCNFIQGEVC